MYDDIERRVASILAAFTIDEIRQLVSEMEAVMRRPEVRIFKTLLPLRDIVLDRSPAITGPLPT